MEFLATAQASFDPTITFGGGFLFYLISSFSLFTIAKNSGEEYAWMAFIPILNILLMCSIAGLSGWFILVMLIPIVNFFFYAYLCMKASEAAGKSEWLGLLLVVPCVNLVAWPYLAFSKN